MRHGKKFNHLSRKSAHRKATLRNMSIALIEHKRIFTTLAKAKALRHFIEPIVTKSKTNSTHSRRVVFGYLQNKDAVKELFDVIAGKIGNRPGGYVRVIRTGFRKGDSADTAMIEFVDFNQTYTAAKKGEQGSTGKRRRRRRRGGSSSVAANTATQMQASTEEE